MTKAGARTGRPLDAKDFTCIAKGGFGEPENNRAHSMAWFQDRLYVGITRHREQKPDFRAPPSRSIRPGVGHHRQYEGQYGQIWRYDPRIQRWQKIFVSPMVRTSEGREVPREVGYRRMVVFQGPSDPAPTLYVSTLSPLGSLILRSEDGENFVPVSEAGLGNLKVWSFRALACCDGRLYASPTGTVGTELIERNRAETPIVFENVDPAAAVWRPVSEVGFGEPTNSSVYEMASLKGVLYAGTFNPYMGFQVWKVCAEGYPYRWKKVITAGAFRGNGNQSVASMCVFGDALYIGSGIQGLGVDKAHNAGPAAAELFRIYPDDNWQLIVGEPRRTFEGKKFPLSGLGPGFDNSRNSVIWQLAEHDGWLYAGTHDWCSLLAFLRPLRPRGRLRLWGALLDELLAKEGGFDLWRSRDGTHWQLVTRVGFGNPGNYGLRTMVSTPVGLFIGTAMVPQMIAGGGLARDLQSIDSQGGCEIWLGRSGT